MCNKSRGKFGNLKIKKNIVIDFKEKKKDPKKWINIGFFLYLKILFLNI